MRLEARVMIWMAVLLGAAAAIALAVMSRLETQRMERQWTEAGEIVASGPADQLRADDTVRKAYLGF